MKASLFSFFTFFTALIIIFSCSKDEDTQPVVTSITLTSDINTVQLGSAVHFTVKTNLDQSVTSQSQIYINGTLGTSSFIPAIAGDYVVKAAYGNEEGNFESNEITITATEIPLTDIVLTSNTYEVEMGAAFTFTVIGNNQAEFTDSSTYYINEAPIDSNVFTSNQTGTFVAKAEYIHEGSTITSNTINLTVLGVPTQTTFFDEIVFYDGYASTVSEPVPAGIIRVSNASYVTKITDADIAKINDELEIGVIIGALCDNYDRIGGLYLNLVNQGNAYASSNVVERMEIGRFITPFMNKNVEPDEVSYSFEVDNIAKILNDPTINANFDFFLEFNVFGVPYAANDQVAGCSGRNDVFRGTVTFNSRNESYTPADQYLKSIASDFSFNDYQAGASDAIGQSVKTFNFTTDSAITNAQIHVIISNHGANSGGEEYNRREHFIYMDNVLINSYIPGGESCEPFRQYNTQGNGIYGATPQPLAYWLSFNNWCPGDVIPIRTYDLGNVSAGSHTFKLDVPAAIFNNDQGHFPVSVYLQGDK